MNLDQQIDILQDNAPNHGISPVVIEKAIAPALKMFAKQLKHENYYLLQNLQQSWILTTLSNRSQPQQQKKVIYAFATSKDAMNFANSSDPKIVADSVPLMQILFQMLAIQPLDSMIFMDLPGNLSSGTEVRRVDVQNLVQTNLKKLQSQTSNLPTDIA